jgi:uncharacterized protein (DUF305 family)
MLTLLWLAACQNPAQQDDNEPRDGGGDAGDALVIPAPYSPPNDAAFVDALTAHHEDAIRMADEVIARGEDADFVAMAGEMRADQQSEIDRLQQIRETLTGAPMNPVTPDPQLDAEIVDLSQRSGMDLERAFLEAMIPHHAGAVQLAHRALPQLENEQLVQIAEDTEAKQAREIGEMRAMLDRAEPPPPEEGGEGQPDQPDQPEG